MYQNTKIAKDEEKFKNKKHGDKIQNHMRPDTRGGLISNHMDQYSEKPESERDFIINNQSNEAQFRKRVDTRGELLIYNQRGMLENRRKAESRNPPLSNYHNREEKYSKKPETKGVFSVQKQKGEVQNHKYTEAIGLPMNNYQRGVSQNYMKRKDSG